MNVSYQWLKTLVNLEGISFERLINDLSLYSIEVEGVHPITVGENLVIGYVEEKVAHPDSDHLSICQVNTGDTVRQIVCGAPNVAKGQKVIVVLPGGHVNNHPIKVSKVRGVESHGMICSLQELGLESKYIPEAYAKGIYVLDENAPIGEDALEYLGLNDIRIELGLTPNRMDLLSMLGVAQDVNAIYQQGLRTSFLNETSKPSSKKASDEIQVKLETSNCYTYYAKVIKNVVIKESPNFIKSRLIASGIRPINNVVDITNYILMLFGQPLHAFDQDKLGNTIVVRRAHPNEKTVTLDRQERILNEKDVVITDGNKVVAIGGVMGGADTEVTPETKNIVLEGAVFRPLSIRRTSSRLGLRSDSSVRFERGVDMNTTLFALEYACYLLEKYADGTVLAGYQHAGATKQPDRIFTITEKFISDYLGVKISLKELVDIFSRLGFKTILKEKEVEVHVMNRRLDIVGKEDLVEEVARIYGYDKLGETLPLMNVSGSRSLSEIKRRTVAQVLMHQGLKETITYSLVSQDKNHEFNLLYPHLGNPISLLNPMSEDHKEMRMGLVSSLIEVLKYNLARQIKDIACFEIGKRYFKIDKEAEDIVEEWVLAGALTGNMNGVAWRGNTEKVDFFLAKGILEVLFKRLGIEVVYRKSTKLCEELHPERTAELLYHGQTIGFLGEIHPKYAKANDLDDVYVFEIILDYLIFESEPKYFTPISKVPAVERDLAFLMDENQPVGEVMEAIYRTDPLITNVFVFDLYQGDKIQAGQKSIALRITLTPEDTLTEEIIQTKMNKIIKMLAYRFNLQLRS